MLRILTIYLSFIFKIFCLVFNMALVGKLVLSISVIEVSIFIYIGA